MRGKEKLKRTLENYGIKPNKIMGQNFLINRGVVKKIIETAELKKTDTVLEIGPGLGALTKELARTFAKLTQNKNAKPRKKVIAVEKDKELTKILNHELGIMNIGNVEIIEGDILKLTTNDLRVTTNYKVVANLPYYITSPVIRKFLEVETPPKLMMLMVQKEVAKRICSRPPNMSILSVAVQFYAEPKIVKIVKKDSFWPKPNVDSAILKINPLINTKNKQINTKQFFKVIKAGFSSPRKQLKNNLKKILNKKEMFHVKRFIDLSRRAESLSIDEWIKIYKTLAKNN